MATGRSATALLLAALLLVGCAARAPKAATPETRHDFGDVPVATTAEDVKTKEFVIRNEGTADLELGEAQVKLLEGC